MVAHLLYGGRCSRARKNRRNKMENIKVNSISEAWRTAARIFPTDYEKNEDSSKRAGYPIYETTSTDERFSGFHISDLNTRLEVNMGSRRQAAGKR